MKKKLIFLITLIITLVCGKNVFAETFREAEYLDKIYMSKYQYSTNTIYYQQARFFRDQSGTYTYCIEPFIFFNEGSTYQETSTPRNLTQEQISRIQKIVYFGYGYKTHRDASWYAITQMMIWKTAAPTEGDYYFTKTLNGERINTYDSKMNEINELIQKYDNEIPIQNQTVTLVEGMSKEITIGDSLEFYTTENKEIELKDNKIVISNLKEGDYSITLHRTIEIMYNRKIAMFEANDSQNMIRRGEIDGKDVSFKIKVIKNHVEFNKVDEDTKESTPQGNASLDGAIYELRDENDVIMKTIEVKDGKGRIEDIPFGTYYLKEKEAGVGYTKNETTYKIVLSEENPNADLEVTNKVIEKKITIQKTYGEKNSQKPEANIDFEIYDKDNKLIKTISTNEEGIVETKLPYGEYKIIQINSTEGYQKINPITIKVLDNEEETIKLEDFKIPVPDTHKDSHSIIWTILKIWMMLW